MTDVLERRKLTVELKGKTYEWVEPVRRDARAMMRELITIHQKANGGDQVKLLEVVDDCLDFFYAFHPKMKADKQRLDDAGEEEIAEAFKNIAEFLASPFATAGKAEAEPTRTPSAESTN